MTQHADATLPDGLTNAQQELPRHVQGLVEAMFPSQQCSPDKIAQLISQVTKYARILKPGSIVDVQQLLVEAVGVCSTAAQQISADTKQQQQQQQQQATPHISPAVLEAASEYLQTVHSISFSQSWLQALGSNIFKSTRNSLCKTMTHDILFLVEGAFVTGTNLRADCHLKKALQTIWDIAKAGAQHLRGGPDEFRCYPLLNSAWVAGMKMLTSDSDSMCKLALHTDGLQQGILTCLLDAIHREMSLFLSSSSDQHIQVMKFWLQHLHRFAHSLAAPVIQIWTEFIGRSSGWLQNLNRRCLSTIEKSDSPTLTMHSLMTVRLAMVCNVTLSGADEDELKACLDTILSQRPLELQLVAEMLARPGLMASPKLRRQAANQLLPLLYEHAASAVHDLEMEAKCTFIGRLQTAALIFLAECCSARIGWQEGQAVLFRMSLNPEPILQQLLLSTWGGILRRCDDELANVHLMALFAVLCGMVQAEAAQDGFERPSAVLEQLVALLAGLVQSSSPGPQLHLEQLAWQAGSRSVHGSVADMAVSAVSCRLLRLAQNSQVPKETLSSRAAVLQETIIQAHTETASPGLLQLLNKGEELLLFLQKASAHHLVDVASLTTHVLDCLASIYQLPQADACRAKALRMLQHLYTPGDDASWLSSLAAVIEDGQLWNSKAGANVASLLGAYASLESQPQALFHPTMTVSAWNVKHAAMQGFLCFMRASSTDFHKMLPSAIYDPGNLQSAKTMYFVHLLKQYMEQRWSAIEPSTTDILQSSQQDACWDMSVLQACLAEQQRTWASLLPQPLDTAGLVGNIAVDQPAASRQQEAIQLLEQGMHMLEGELSTALKKQSPQTSSCKANDDETVQPAITALIARLQAVQSAPSKV
ncbi:hypothetical protein WJX74_001202 [Apatococcus lobatus]|uniref:Uncharacterized protein n=1 Tax=Apatococcus lobatus TaxID=904363 RepID=A0AAW1S5Q2_9CHLO